MEVSVDGVPVGSITNDAYMLGSGVADGCFGTVDLTKTVVEERILVS